MESMNNVNLLLQRSRLALQEFGPSMALLTLPGGYLIALTDWIHRRWPPSTDSRQTLPSAPSRANYSSAVARAVDWLGDRYLLSEPVKAITSISATKAERMPTSVAEWPASSTKISREPGHARCSSMAVAGGQSRS